MTLKEWSEHAEVNHLTELCDVCGHDVPIKEVIRTTFKMPYGTRFVVRHHVTCNPQNLIDLIERGYEIPPS